MTFDLCLSKTCQKETVIIIGEKSHLAIVASLNDVMRIRRNCDSRGACHATISVWEYREPIAGSAHRQEKKFSDPIFFHHFLSCTGRSRLQRTA